MKRFRSNVDHSLYASPVIMALCMIALFVHPCNLTASAVILSFGFLCLTFLVSDIVGGY